MCVSRDFHVFVFFLRAASTVLTLEKDLPLLQISHDDWMAVQKPKVKGTWNLHEVFSGADVDLDFFILFSSLSSAWGQPGQASYASANTFLNSFAQYRRNLNLPCSVIDIGGIEGVGVLSENPAILSQIRAISAITLEEQDLFNAIQVSISRSLRGKAAPGPRRGYLNPDQLAIGLRSSSAVTSPSNRCLAARYPHEPVPAARGALRARLRQ